MSEITPSLLIESQFDSFEEFAELIVSWDADFRQITAESYKSEIFQAQIGSMLITGASFGCQVDQHGATPAGMRTFAIPDVDCSEMRWYGRVTGPDTLFVFPVHGEIEVLSRPGLSVMTFSIPENLLAEFFEKNGVTEPGNILGSEAAIIHASPIILKKIRYLFQFLAKGVKGRDKHASYPILNTDFQEQIMFCLLQILEGDRPVPKVVATGSGSKIECVITYIDAHSKEPLRISDLCAIARVSERTLQNIFRQYLGMTPKSYLAGQRMYTVHRELWHADSTRAYVSDVANDCGFWHMGQFAADYRKIFGELPSSTLNR